MATKKQVNAGDPSKGLESKTKEIEGTGTEEKLNETEQAAANAAREARKNKPKGNWVDLSDDQLKKAQEDGLLIGYDHKTKQGLLRKSAVVSVKPDVVEGDESEE